jgi:hypothetical protein
MLGFTIGSPKYLEGLDGPNPPPKFDGCPTKNLSTFLGIFVCILTRFIPLGVCGLDFTLVMVWVGVIVNGASVTVIIEWGIATKYNGTDFIGSTLKLEVLT